MTPFPYFLAALLGILFAVIPCAAQPKDGFYLLERDGEGPAIVDTWGKEWALGAELDLHIDGNGHR